MAIQMRRGNKADFDPTKMLPGEWAVSIDSDTTKQWVWMCFAPGVVKRMAAFEDIEWVLSDEFAKSAVICDVELDSTATKDYAVGDFLMLHGHLYEVTVAITTGDTIEEDVNVTETRVMDTIAGKVDKETGKGLSTNDYTDTEKAALAQAQSDIVSLNADLANKQDASTAVRSVNSITPTNGDVAINAEDIPADGIGDKSVSGNPITIEDGMASVAKGLSVTLEPIQDLHGYESPWIGTDTDKAPYLFRAVSDSSVQDKGTHELDKIVGGTVAFNQLVDGNNLTGSDTVNGITYTNNGDGSVTVSGTATSTSGKNISSFYVPMNHAVVIYSGVTGGSWGTYVPLYDNNNNVISYNREATMSRTYNSSTVILRTQVWTGQTVNFTIKPMLFDLTQMFGSTIADYIYSLEQATAGAGVAWFRNLFPAPYYAYNAGSLISVKTSAHVMRGFNQWDEEWEVGSINSEGQKVSSTTKIRSKNYIPCAPNTTYCRTFVGGSSNVIAVYAYDANYNYLPSIVTSGSLFTTPDNAQYLLFRTADSYGATYNHDICINLSKTTGTPKNGDYVAYDGHSYPLDSDLELRGIPKLDSNNKLYYDGDIYEASGNVQRKYGIVTFDGSDDEQWRAYSTGYRFVVSVPDFTSPATNVYADLLTSRGWKIVQKVGMPSGIPSECCISGSDNGNHAFIVNVGKDSVTAVREYLAENPITIVYPVTTPTTETADPYTSTQVIDPDGTEEYVDARTVAIPVGHESNYANICPIEGRTGTEVQRTGKNLLNISPTNEVKKNGASGFTLEYLSDNSVTMHTSSVAAYYVVYGILDGIPQSMVGSQIVIGGENVSSQRLVLADDWGGSSTALDDITTYPYTIKQADVGRKLGFRFYNATGNDRTIRNVQVERNSSASAYEPYHAPDTASVTFGQTVYGCTHDFVSGKCRVTHGIVDLGTLDWVSSNHRFNSYTELTNAKVPQLGLCSMYKSDPGAATRTVDYSIYIVNGNGYVYIYDTSKEEDGTTFKAAMSGVQLCYELATPTTVQLTPAQLTLLQGTNILTADGTINLTYLGSMASNVQDEIDEFESGLNNVIGSIAFIENSTAKTSHAVGDYVILNGIFCKVIAAVSSGETLSFGTNIQATTIGAELRAIWAELNA